ncbi:MAG: hypothetical protein PHZ19_00825, partial [Candidatus Thermoplasmatota archaeon]|nr:hypothetical protein [Candidatus Thermoplasmatota archaeon]
MQDIREIGVVHNDVHEPTDPFEMRKQESVIEIHEQYANGLYRIEDSDYICGDLLMAITPNNVLQNVQLYIKSELAQLSNSF